jgi:hypothetical protein
MRGLCLGQYVAKIDDFQFHDYLLMLITNFHLLSLRRCKCVTASKGCQFSARVRVTDKPTNLTREYRCYA